MSEKKVQVPGGGGRSPNPSWGCPECTTSPVIPVRKFNSLCPCRQEVDETHPPSQGHSRDWDLSLSMGQKKKLLAIKDWLFHACVPGWTCSARAVSVFQTKVMIVPTRTRIILRPGKTTGDSPAIFNKRSAFKCSDSEHNSNQDSRFSRGKPPTPEH